MDICPAPELDSLIRDDLRQPKIVFGRCCVTGEWGACVALDLGNICVDAPNTEQGVEYDPVTKEVTFTAWKPTVFNTQVTISKEGLTLLMTQLDTQPSPIPSVGHELVYEWHILYTDGSGLGQFRFKDDDSPEELHSGDIDFDRVMQFVLRPRFDTTLPTFTFIKDTGKVYRNEEELDLDYDGVHHATAPMVYGRKVTHTWGSAMEQHSLNRSMECMSTTVLQLIGWKVGGREGAGPGCIIAIDDRGNWRPWEYTE